MAKGQVKEDPKTENEAEETEASPPAPTPRRAPGQKEVIPFEWKVCGYAADGHTLTLFKSIERADSEQQLARLIGEGYYDGLAVYKVDDAVPESAKAKKLRLAKSKKSKKSEKDKTEDTTSTKETRKSTKGPVIVTTPMGKVVDGRITVRRKKGLPDRKEGKGSKAKSSAKKKAAAPSKTKATTAKKSTAKATTAKTTKKATAKKAASSSKKKTVKKAAKKAPAKKAAAKTASKTAAAKKTVRKKTKRKK